jgi:DNA-binding HxlR family transcriptional regulator
VRDEAMAGTPAAGEEELLRERDFGAGAVLGLERRAGATGTGANGATGAKADAAAAGAGGAPCPFVTVQQLLQGKWSILVLHHLSEGPLRFNELRRRLPQLTAATLTSQLRYLEAHGMVRRRIFPEVPPRVEYSLTDLGESFKPVLDQIQAWGTHYLERRRDADAGGGQV